MIQWKPFVVKIKSKQNWKTNWFFLIAVINVVVKLIKDLKNNNLLQH